jgi:hypothetical protein
MKDKKGRQLGSKNLEVAGAKLSSSRLLHSNTYVTYWLDHVPIHFSASWWS